MQPAHVSVLDRVRALCMALPEATETRTLGNPTFQITGKTFCVVESYRGEFCVSIKVGKPKQSSYLRDERFFRTPYVGRYGWVSLRVDAAPLNWTEIQDLIEASYRQIAPKRLVAIV